MSGNRLLPFLLALGCAALSAAQPKPRYRVIDLGLAPDGRGFYAAMIGDNNATVGNITSGYGATVYWTPEHGARFVPSLPGYGWINPYDINGNGVLCGDADKNGAARKAVLWDERLGPRELFPIRSGYGLQLEAYGINDRGQVAGRVFLPNDRQGSFVFSPPNQVRYLDNGRGQSLPGNYYRINESGQVAGDGYDPAIQASSGFYWSESTGTVWLGGLPNRRQSFVRGIDDSGRVVGWAWGPGVGGARTFEWTLKGGIRELPIVDRDNRATDTNNAGTVVGNVYVGGQYQYYGFVYTPTDGAWPVSDLVDETGAGWVLVSCSGVNNNGWISGGGYHWGERRAFVLVPLE